MSTALDPAVEQEDVVIYDHALSDEEIASGFERLSNPAVEVEDHGRTLPHKRNH